MGEPSVGAFEKPSDGALPSKPYSERNFGSRPKSYIVIRIIPESRHRLIRDSTVMHAK